MWGYPQFNSEFVVAGAIGNPRFDSTKAFPTAFYSKRGRHSEKPDAFYDLLRRVAPKPALDIFNRRHIIGFDSATADAYMRTTNYPANVTEPSACALQVAYSSQWGCA